MKYKKKGYKGEDIALVPRLPPCWLFMMIDQYSTYVSVDNSFNSHQILTNLSNKQQDALK